MSGLVGYARDQAGNFDLITGRRLAIRGHPDAAIIHLADHPRTIRRSRRRRSARSRPQDPLPRATDLVVSRSPCTTSTLQVRRTCSPASPTGSGRAGGSCSATGCTRGSGRRSHTNRRHVRPAEHRRRPGPVACRRRLGHRSGLGALRPARDHRRFAVLMPPACRHGR